MADFPTSLTSATDGVTDVLAKHLNNVEAKIGIDSSAVTTSLDYKLSGVTGTDKAVSKTGTETLTNKTLTSPVVNSPTGDVVTLTGTQTLTNKTLTSPKIGTDISDTNGNEIIKFTATASAVDEITITNAAANGTPTIAATGTDTDIDLDLRAKGDAVVKFSARNQSNTTNSTQSGCFIECGWGFMVGDGTSTISETVTYPTPPTTVLSFSVTFIGYTDGSDPAGIANFSPIGGVASVSGVSTTAAAIRIDVLTGTIAASRRVGYSWVLIGN